ncbi:transposase (plasmid) [Bradyrhizobium sp. 62B]|nr:transposase [Bradyrhizobium sp. 62B]
MTRFIDEGRIELNNKTVERSIRGISSVAKNALCIARQSG